MSKSYIVHLGTFLFVVTLTLMGLLNYNSNTTTTPTPKTQKPNHNYIHSLGKVEPVSVCRVYLSKEKKRSNKQGGPNLMSEKWKSIMSCPNSFLQHNNNDDDDNLPYPYPSFTRVILERLSKTPLVREDYLKLFFLLESGGIAADSHTIPRRTYPTQWFHSSIQTNDCSLLLGLDDDDASHDDGGLISVVSSAALASAIPHSSFLARSLSLLDDRVKQAPSNVVFPRNFVSSVLGEVLEASIKHQYGRVGKVNVSISDVPGVYGGKSIRQDRNELVKVDWRVAGRGVGMQVDTVGGNYNGYRFGKGVPSERVCVMGKLLFRQFVVVD